MRRVLRSDAIAASSPRTLWLNCARDPLRQTGRKTTGCCGRRSDVATDSVANLQTMIVALKFARSVVFAAPCRA